MQTPALVLAIFFSAACAFPGSEHTRARRSDDPSPMEALLQQQAAAIQTLQAQLTDLQTHVDANTQQRNKAVAFTVRFANDQAVVAPKGVLRFDTVAINSGNGYSTHSGIFTAPYSGTYVFMVNIMVLNTNSYMQVAIDKSGTTVLAEAHADSTGGDQWDKGMAHATVHLDSGDEVWVRHNAGDAGLFGGWWTTFTGFLVHAD